MDHNNKDTLNTSLKRKFKKLEEKIKNLESKLKLITLKFTKNYNIFNIMV